jgi:L-lysine 2,3-aminomutase
MKTWQTELKQAITDPEVLLRELKLDTHLLPQARQAAKLFPLKVTRSFLKRMHLSDPNDPLLRQVLPLGLEHQRVDGFSVDPLKELAANPIPGLLHKYHGRVLITLTPTCGINCRYCFRRHFPYQKNLVTQSVWQNILAYIRNDRSIHEIILSGGDPLIISDRLLLEKISMIETMDHVTTLRIHSRLPIILPSRITPNLVSALGDSRLRLVLVLHCNHDQELDDAMHRQSLNRLRNQGVFLLNQTVLLKGVNDQSDTLINLSKKLFNYGILPYYLHLLDKVHGAAHFEVTETQALNLMHKMRKYLPGYLVPRLVREESGADAKTILC